MSFRTKVANLESFRSVFENAIVIFEITTFKFVKIENSCNRKKN